MGVLIARLIWLIGLSFGCFVELDYWTLEFSLFTFWFSGLIGFVCSCFDVTVRCCSADFAELA